MKFFVHTAGGIDRPISAIDLKPDGTVRRVFCADGNSYPGNSFNGNPELIIDLAPPSPKRTKTAKHE